MLSRVVILSLLWTLSGCSLVFSEAEGTGEGTGEAVSLDPQSRVGSALLSTRLAIPAVSTPGPDRVILAQVGWCNLEQAEPPATVECGPLSLVRVGREAPTDACGVEFWAAYSEDPLSNVECLIEMDGGVNDIGAVIVSLENASPELAFNVLGDSQLEPAILGIPWSRDSSYVVGFGLGYPPGELIPTDGATLLQDFVIEGGDQLWSVGRPGTAEVNSVLGVLSNEEWLANHFLMVEITAR